MLLMNACMQFAEVSCVLPSGRKVLDRISGDFPHTNLHAIMGPSGSGKSTLISALIGKTNGGAMTGEVVVWRDDGAGPLEAGKDPWVKKHTAAADGEHALSNPGITKCSFQDIK